MQSLQSKTNTKSMSRRTFLSHGSTALAGLAAFNLPGAAWAFALQDGEVVLPWLNQRAGDPPPERVANQQTWEKLNTWITPNDQFFSIAHYNRPEIDATDWHLEISPQPADIYARRDQVAAAAGSHLHAGMLRQ